MLDRAPRITVPSLIDFYGRRIKRLLPAFGSTAEDGTDPRACFYRHVKLRRPFDEDCDIRLDSAMKDQRLARTHLLDDLKSRYPSVIVVDLEAAQRRDGRCTTVIDGTPIYSDTHHLNAFGAAMLVTRYRDRFDNPLMRDPPVDAPGR